MKYKVTFKWTEEVTTTRQLILEADSKQHARDLVTYSVEPQNLPCEKWDNKKIEIDDENGSEDGYSGINGGYRDEIGVEIDKEFYGDADYDIKVEESK